MASNEQGGPISSKVRDRESWSRTLLNGAAGGLLGAAAMWGLQRVMRSHLQQWGRSSGEPDTGIGFQAEFRDDEPASTVARIALPEEIHSRMSPRTNALLVHGAFGIGSGIAYAAARREIAFLSKAFGLPFGLVLWLAAAEFGLPAISLSRGPHRSSPTVQVFGLCAHLLYSATAEGTCRALEAACTSHQRSF